MRFVTGRVSTAVALMAAALLALPVAAPAQSLGQAAEKAKKSRKGKSKVITETDLRKGAPEAPVTSSETTSSDSTEAPAAEATTGTTPAPAAKTEDEIRAEAETKWREQLQQAEAEVSRLSSEANQIQTRLNDLTQNLYGGGRAAMTERLEVVQRELATARQSVADLQENGRRSRYRSVPGT